jgi:hypothetical protein
MFQLAIDSAGSGFLGWVRCQSAAVFCPNDVLISRYDGARWSSPEFVGGPALLWDLHLATEGPADAVAVWSTPYIAVSLYRGNSGWTKAEEQAAVEGFATQEPQVAMDHQGNILMVWRQYDAHPNSDGRVLQVWANYYRAGSGWTGAVPIGPAIGWAGNQQVALDESGRGSVIWIQCDSTLDPVRQCLFRVWSTRFDPETGWEAAGSIQPDVSDEYAYAPRIVVDRSGNATALWTLWKGATNGFSIWANHYRMGQGWGSAEPVVLDLQNVDWTAWRAGVDGNGRTLLVWMGWNPSEAVFEIDTVRYEPGAGWSTPVAIQDLGIFPLRGLAVAVNGPGEAVALWSQQRDESTDLWASRYDIETGWQSPVVLDTGPEDVLAPQIAIDDTGSAVAVWYQNGLWSSCFPMGCQHYRSSLERGVRKKRP